MALIVCFASVMPCADSVGALNKNRSVVMSSTQNRSTPRDIDLCSPFCICSCCAGFTYAPNLCQIVWVKPIVSNNKLHFINADISNISLPIWQPPQLIG